MLISSGLFSKLSQRCIVFLASGARSLMSLEVFVLWFFFLCVFFFFFFTTDPYKYIVCEWLSSILVPFQFGLLLLRIKTKLPSWFRSHWADVDQWSRWLLHHSFRTSLSLSLKPKLPGVFLQHYGVTDRKSLNVDMVWFPLDKEACVAFVL